MGDLSRVLTQFDKVKKAGMDSYMVSCPLHSDRQPSLHITHAADGNILFRCHQCGAGLAELRSTLPGLTPDITSAARPGDWPRVAHAPSVPPPPPPEPDAGGVTLSKLAAYTKLDVDTLSRFGLADDGGKVIVDYFDRDKRRTSRKFRVSLRSKGKYTYEKGGKVTAYGLWRKPMEKTVFVEGESDCWTLWSHRIAAIGIPGATQSNALRQGDTAGIKTAFVIQETGDAGRHFSRELAGKLEEFGVEEIRIVDMGEDDDPSTFYQQEPATFRERFLSLLDSGRTLEEIEAEETFKSAEDARVSTIAWFHQPYIPQGSLTLLAGAPGTGKTSVAAYYAGAVSAGRPMPESKLAPEPGRVLFMSREDGEAGIRSRLEANRAYLANIRILTESSDLRLDADGVRKLRSAIKLYLPKLVVLDPVVDYLTRDMDMNHAQDVRSITKPLMEMAEEFDVAMLLVAHTSKRVNVTDVQDIASGSKDWVASSRSVLALFHDPAVKEGKVMAHVKSNNARFGQPLRFELADEDRAAAVRWQGPSPLSADDLQSLMATPQARIVLREAVEALRDLLTAESRSKKDVQKIMRMEGVPNHAVRAAKKVLQVEEIGTMWRLPFDSVWDHDPGDGDDLPA